MVKGRETCVLVEPGKAVRKGFTKTLHEYKDPRLS